ERAIKEGLKEGLLKQLPRVKNYLHNLILKSMNAYHADSSSNTTLNELMAAITFLLNKSLYKQCNKLIIKAKKIAQESENHLKVLEVIGLERRLANEANIGALNHIAHEEEKIWQILDNIRDYKKINDQIYLVTSSQGKVRNLDTQKQLKEIMALPLLSNENKALSYEAKLRYYNIHAFYADLIGDIASAYRQRKKQVALMEGYPNRIEDAPNTYVTLINNLMTSQLGLKKFNEINIYLKELRRIPARSTITQARIFSNSFNMELAMLLTLGKFEQGIALVSEIEEGLVQFKDKIIKQHIFNFYMNISNAYFGVEDYSKALLWINKLFELKEINTRQDIQALARIYNLIIHFELKNSLLLPYSALSTYRFLIKRNTLYKSEKIILRFIKNYPSLTDNKEITNAFKNLKKEISSLLDDPFEKRAFEFFDLMSWLESKIEKKSFAEIIKEKAMIK
ncbi:MAG: hypothetical protein ACT4ON_12855, partial [Bacteroidota bacterium]